MTIVISAVVSLTLVPMMCAKLLQANAAESTSQRFERGAKRFID